MLVDKNILVFFLKLKKQIFIFPERGQDFHNHVVKVVNAPVSKDLFIIFIKTGQFGILFDLLLDQFYFINGGDLLTADNPRKLLGVVLDNIVAKSVKSVDRYPISDAANDFRQSLSYRMDLTT